MKYQELAHITREEAEKIFKNGSPEEIGEALYRIANHERDWQWVEKWCVHFCKHPNGTIRRIAVICLSDLIRIHRDKRIRRVTPLLKELLNDAPEVAEEAQRTLEHLQIFLTPKSN